MPDIFMYNMTQKVKNGWRLMRVIHPKVIFLCEYKKLDGLNYENMHVCFDLYEKRVLRSITL